MSNLAIKKPERGFTLIEIVLVLAIAGLIMLIVFLAVSGAQKSRRDTQRKEDLSRLGSQLESFASNDSGLYPGNAGAPAANLAAAGFTSYVPANFNDPLSGAPYAMPAVLANAPASATAGTISYDVGAGTTCDGVANASARVWVLRMSLEQGVACRDNK